MLRLSSAAAACAVIACSNAPPTTVVATTSAIAPPPPAPTAERYALLWTNAMVHTAVGKAQMKAYPDEERAQRPGDVWPVRIVDDSGEKVKVRTLGLEDENHCYRGPSYLTALAIEVEVLRSDLASVTGEPIRKTFADGTWIALNAGVALTSNAAVADGVSIPVTITSSTSYTRGPKFDVARMRHASDNPLRVGEQDVVIEPFTMYPLLRVTPREGTFVVSAVTGCMQLEAIATSEPERVDRSPPDQPIKTPSLKDAKHFPIGTALRWRNGERAGDTVDALALSLVEKKGDLLCFTRSLAEPDPGQPMPEHHRMELCVSPDDAKDVPQPRARIQLRTRPPL